MKMIHFAVLAAAAALAVAAEVLRELHHFKVTRYCVESERLSGAGAGLRVLFLSDLHNRSYGRRNERLLEAVRREEPDLILIGGDMLVGKADAGCDTALEFVRMLPQICPVIYANGNHEQRIKESPNGYRVSYCDYKRELESAGVRFLENRSQKMTIRGRTVIVSGLELPASTYRKFQKSAVSGREVASRLGGYPKELWPGSYSILLAHNPAYMDAYLEWGADLILSGHLHGGLVRLPWIGGVVTPQGFLFPEYSGEMTRKGEQTVVVSRGLGTHTLNIRFLNPPEIVSIRLNGTGKHERKGLRAALKGRKKRL